ncbi:GNVR domain-containing protein [Burkholderia guangdongensis]|uniref:GNVR domain-containing protein n=1 Tax=Burkholderia guangdongensis TaxID=1792500 RepID=UPI0015C91907|nr:GNVR domain-containing protein [Burkholderia guangdongensis]
MDVNQDYSAVPDHALERLVALARMLRDGARMIALCTAGAMLAGLAYLACARPVYQADLMVQIENSPDTTAFRSLLGDVSSLFAVRSTAAAETQILASRLVVSRAVDALALFVDARPKRLPLIGHWFARRGDGAARPGLFGWGGYTWGTARIRVSHFDVPRALAGCRFTLTYLGDGRYRLAGETLGAGWHGRVGELARRRAGDGELALRVDAIDAQPGAAFELIRLSRRQAIDTLRNQLSVQERIKQSDVVIASLRGDDPEQVSRTLNEIGVQYIRQSLERKAEEAAKSLDFLEARLPALRRQLTESEARLTALRDARGSIDLAEEARLALATLADLATRTLELQLKRDALLSGFTSAHPSVQALDRQLAALGARRDAAEQTLRRLPALQQTIVRLMLDVKVNTDLYTALLNNMQQLQLVQAGNVGNVRLVDVAVTPEMPIGPHRRLVAAASLLLGLLTGGGIVIARGLLWRGVDDPREVAHAARARVVARVGADARSLEDLRGLRMTLRDTGNPFVLLVAPDAGAGCAFIAARLAALSAATGARVLLVDADPHRANLSARLGCARAPGLSDWLAGPAHAAPALRVDCLEGVAVLPAGAPDTHATDRLAGLASLARLSALARNYDRVLVVAPPVLAWSDAGAFAPLAGTVLLVARAGATRLAALADAARRLADYGVAPDGVVLNGGGRAAPGARAGERGRARWRARLARWRGRQ